ncbi:MAG TPA: AAA family ATPase [Actinomycetota bacterium]|nr:AAA family ATPase [Actinomycetota bacterium]
MRGIIRELGETDADVTVVDLEAGLEHLKRGTPRHTDALVVVAEPYFRSIQTAATTAELGRELGIGTVGIVANKVRDERDESVIRDVGASRDVPVLGVIPYDDAVIEADRRPAALIDVDPASGAVRGIEGIVDRLAAARNGEGRA